MSIAKKATPAFSSNTHIKSETFASLKIVQQSYDCDKDNIIFSLRDINGHTYEQTAGEIALNAPMVDALPPHDILLIGYVAGMEHSEMYTRG